MTMMKFGLPIPMQIVISILTTASVIAAWTVALPFHGCSMTIRRQSGGITTGLHMHTSRVSLSSVASTTGSTKSTTTPTSASASASTRTTPSTTFRLLLSASSNDNNDNNDNINESDNDDDDDDDEAWDENVDYDKLWMDPNSANSNPLPTSAWDDFTETNDTTNNPFSLGLPTGIISQLIDDETAMELKEEAKRIIDSKMQEGMEELTKLRAELNDDIAQSKRRMERSSQTRMVRQEEQLLNRIDALTESFLQESKGIRESTKMAAAADAAMGQRGSGIEIGSWGTLTEKGLDVTLGSGGIATDGSSILSTNGGVLLGSVEYAKQRQEQWQGDEKNEGIPRTLTENRILIVADEASDPYAKQLIPAFSKAMSDIIPINIEILKPTQQMPLGGNNAACVLLFLTSLSSSPRSILERLLRRTMSSSSSSSSSSSLGRPPTQLVAISTIGTERTDKFPYSMQNLLGRKLETRRDMEETIVTMVQERAVPPPLDYTILKFGELQNGDEKNSAKMSDDNFNFFPGDVLDGTTSLALAAQTLIQAIAHQPAARNSTLCATGNLPLEATRATTTTTLADSDDMSPSSTKNEAGSFEFWDDVFLKLKGPELIRYESLNLNSDKYVQLVEYLKEWGTLFADSGKLTTRVNFVGSLSSTGSRQGKHQQRQQLLESSILERDGFQLLFQPTNTGQYYLSKDEERELEQKGLSPSSRTGGRSVGGKADGGVEVLVEVTTKGLLRVRATRTNMGKDTVIKELSETTILKRLEDSLNLFVRDFC